MPDRRSLLAMLGLSVLAPARAFAASIPGQTAVTAYAFSFDKPDGGRLSLADFTGRPLLVVNTATACAYAPQFEGLEQLWTRFGPRGLGVVAVPSDDFGQEPLSGAAIAEAAGKQHGVTFPVVGKTSVRGPGAHPFYRWAAAERPGETPNWNFHKYLIGRDGRVAGSFVSATKPTDSYLITAVAREVGAA